MSKQKTIIVYGTGISGKGAAEVLLKHGHKVFLYNDNQCQIEADLLRKLQLSGGDLVCGEFSSIVKDADGVILSPGIPADNENVILAQNLGIEVISEVEYADRIYSGHMIAITGTNGKTTTTTLVGDLLKKLSAPSAVGGNIGFALSKETDTLPANGWLAAELSSFQLEFTESFCPDIAVMLNLTPDHMERHHTMEAYAAAKKKILVNQKPSDYTILNYDDEVVRAWQNDTKGQVCFFSRKEHLKQGVYLDNDVFTICWNGEKIPVCHKNELHLFGGHNEENVMAAIACGYFVGVKVADIADVLRNFHSVEHRLEYVTTIDGVAYYNDSKATNTDSAIKALEAFPDGHIILLAGGHDKLTPLEDMMNLVREKTDALILLGEAKERFYKAAVACEVKNILLVDSFEDAVNKAYALAESPQVVLLSPACSSFDMFKNYPERGRYFKKLVNELKK